jgi:hypothetical protein
MVDIDPNALLLGIIGAGGATFITAAVKAVKDLRSGARAKDRDTVGSLREQRDDAERRCREASEDRDHWHRIVGRLMFQLERAGLTPTADVNDLVPPSQRNRTTASPRRRGRTTT